MKFTKPIRRDSHGRYIITDGGVYRPELSRNSYPSRFDLPRWKSASFADGEKVHAHHVSQSPHARLKGEDGRIAMWHLHGYTHRLDRVEGKMVRLAPETQWEPREPEPPR